MTRNQAVAMAEQLAAKGTKLSEIAMKLAEAGYLSPQTGKAIHPASVHYMLKKKQRQSPQKKAAQSVEPTLKSTGGKLGAVRSILKLHGMDASERVALALLVIG